MDFETIEEFAEWILNHDIEEVIDKCREIVNN